MMTSRRTNLSLPECLNMFSLLVELFLELSEILRGLLGCCLSDIDLLPKFRHVPRTLFELLFQLSKIVLHVFQLGLVVVDGSLILDAVLFRLRFRDLSLGDLVVGEIDM